MTFTHCPGCASPACVVRDKCCSPRRPLMADLRSLRDPSPAMLKAAFTAMNATPSGEWKRLKAEGLTPRELFDAKMIPRWQAMIDHLLKEAGE